MTQAVLTLTCPDCGEPESCMYGIDHDASWDLGCGRIAKVPNDISLLHCRKCKEVYVTFAEIEEINRRFFKDLSVEPVFEID